MKPRGQCIEGLSVAGWFLLGTSFFTDRYQQSHDPNCKSILLCSNVKWYPYKIRKIADTTGSHKTIFLNKSNAAFRYCAPHQLVTRDTASTMTKPAKASTRKSRFHSLVSFKPLNPETEAIVLAPTANAASPPYRYQKTPAPCRRSISLHRQISTQSIQTV